MTRPATRTSSTRATIVVVPASPPTLNTDALRALLRILVNAAERERAVSERRAS